METNAKSTKLGNIGEEQEVIEILPIQEPTIVPEPEKVPDLQPERVPA